MDTDARDKAYELCLAIAEKWIDYAITPQAKTVAQAIAREIKSAYDFSKALDLEKKLRNQYEK